MPYVILKNLKHGTKLRLVATGECFSYESAGTLGGDGWLVKLMATPPFGAIPNGPRTAVAAIATAKAIEHIDRDVPELVLDGYVIEADPDDGMVHLVHFTFAAKSEIERDFIQNTFRELTTPRMPGYPSSHGLFGAQPGFAGFGPGRPGNPVYPGYAPAPMVAPAFGDVTNFNERLFSIMAADPIAGAAVQRLSVDYDIAEGSITVKILCPAGDLGVWMSRPLLKAQILRFTARAYGTQMCAGVTVANKGVIPHIEFATDKVEF